MVLPIDELHLDIDDREARDHAGGKNALDTLFDAGNVASGHRTAADPGFELVAFSGLLGSTTSVRAANWPVPAGLPPCHVFCALVEEMSLREPEQGSQPRCHRARPGDPRLFLLFGSRDVDGGSASAKTRFAESDAELLRVVR